MSKQSTNTTFDRLENTEFVYNRYNSLTIKAQREKLPIFKYRQHILYLLEKFQCVLIIGETGSGKSTQIPQYMIETGWPGQIAVSEPRRVAAISLAKRVATETGTTVQKDGMVGYAVKWDICVTRPKIKYLTEGMLMREMMADPLLSDYCGVMLDEVHERTLFIDVLMGLLKKVLKKRKSLKLIVSSATLNAEFLRDFFNFNQSKDRLKDTAVIISVEGRQFPVEVFYVKEPVPDYVQATVDTIIKIHNTQKSGDILAFLTGQDEVDYAISLLRNNDMQSPINKEKLLALPMYGSLRYKDQLEVFKYAASGFRKVIIATNIAESSITIPNIVYVIDCGFAKMKWFLSDAYLDSLVVLPISRASANQRSGRAGRTRSGKAFRLYTESDALQLPEITAPEMIRCDLMSTVLYLKAMGIENVLRFDFPSAPPAKNLLSAIELLIALGALDPNGSLTKPVGETMAEFALEPLLSKLLLSAIDFDCVNEMLSIVAMLQVEDVFSKPTTGKMIIAARMKKRNFESEEGDLITLLNVYTAFMISEESVEFCSMNFLNYHSLKKVVEIRKHLQNMLVKKLGDDNVPNVMNKKSTVENLQKCIVSAMFPNAAYLHSSGVYKTVRGDVDLYIHPNSVLYTLKQQQWLVFYKIVHTSKTFMHFVTVIQQRWLIELAPHFYQITQKFV